MGNKTNRIQEEIEFINKLKANQLTTPNEFTIGMGEMIKKAREEQKLSQAELADRLNRRQATISNIENGKSEIGVVTLLQFAVKLQKPITYFFPPSLLKDIVVDIKSPFQQNMLELAREIEAYGDQELTIDILNVLISHFGENFSEFQ